MTYLAKAANQEDPQNNVDAQRKLKTIDELVEAYIENHAKKKFPASNEGVLNEVPLLGISEHGRPKKFFLGKLARYRTKTVQELIDESVNAHLGNFSVNNVAGVSMKGFSKRDLASCGKPYAAALDLWQDESAYCRISGKMNPHTAARCAAGTLSVLLESCSLISRYAVQLAELHPFTYPLWMKRVTHVDD